MRAEENEALQLTFLATPLVQHL